MKLKYTGPERRKIKREPKEIYYQKLRWEQKNRREPHGKYFESGK